jgi:hypothetical protein
MRKALLLTCKDSTCRRRAAALQAKHKLITAAVTCHALCKHQQIASSWFVMQLHRPAAACICCSLGTLCLQ